MKKALFTATLLFSLFRTSISFSQSPEKPLSVGIFVYPGVEILDFSGPSEVFASTPGFKAFTVAFKKEPVISQGFIKITPEYSIEDCPPTDILVFPGGGTNSVMDETVLIDWIRQRAGTTQIMMSVCTGAGLLSKAGLLDGKEVTTFFSYLSELQRITPKAKVLANTRFVDNGQIVTTAGVSAGIDGALHVVSKIKGEAMAKATATYMQYDKWDPAAGKINESAFLQEIRNSGLSVALQHDAGNAENGFPKYYPGELNAMALSLLDTKPAESEAIIRYLLKQHPPSVATYDVLGRVLARSGKTVPPESHVFLEKLRAGDLQWAKITLEKTLKTEPGWMFFTEEDLNQMAYNLMNQQKSQEALGIFKWITELFPASPNAWDSLSEYYELHGENALAITASETCLAKLPASGYPETRKKQYEKIASERITKLKTKP